MFLLTIYEEGERGKKKKRRIGGGLYKFIPMYIVSLYLCIWMERPVSLPMYIGVEVENFGGKGEGGVSLWIFSLSFYLGFYLQYMGISFLRPGRPPCRLACKPSCKLTLSGYGISYRRRRKGDHGVLVLGRAVANLYGRLVFEMDRCKSKKWFSI